VRRAALALLACTSTLAAQGPPLRTRIDDAVTRVAPELIAIRQHIHQNPELGNREFETAKTIAAHLRALGLEVRTGVAHTGVVGILRGGKPGPVVAVRSDMDALPVTEASGYPLPSTKRGTYLGKDVGIAHACGHDIHMAVILGVATVLAGMKDQVAGTVMFIFQPAEEGSPEGEEGGAPLMLKEGLFRTMKPEAIFGLHTEPGLPVGQVGYAPGPFFANSDAFVAIITGKQSHGAAPHESVDPIVLASQVVLALQTIHSRNVPPLEASVITVGVMRGGERYNIIPSQVELIGTVRSYSAATRDLIERRMREVMAGTTAAGGGSYTLTYTRGSPAIINDTALTLRMVPTLARVLGPGNAKIIAPTMGGEDFAFFANEVPGMFIRLGTTKPGGTSGGWHTPTYLGDDSAVPMGIRVMSNLLVDFLDSATRK
jgi:amidohydrolase